MNSLAGSVRSAARSLRPGPSPLAVAAAVRAFVAAGVIAGFGVLAGDLQVVAVAYLGAACAVAFVGAGPYRLRAVGLATQGVGAGQALGYLAGTVVVAVAALVPWAFQRDALEREAAAAVMSAAADLGAAVGTVQRREARARLAAASAAARVAGPQPAAELVAFAAATMYADGESVPEDAVTAMRTAAAQICAGLPVAVDYSPPADSPGLQALADALSGDPRRPAAPHARQLAAALRSTVSRSAAANAARIALCMGVATALTVLLHEPAHSFWLPLTVAVIVRPEYASVFVRTVNRVCGTLVGAAVTALLLMTHPPEPVVAAGAAVALGFAVLTAPKLYALNVTGVTASALLSSSLAAVDPVLPGLRLLDTVMGAAVAVVFGYLLWPGARRLPTVARIDAAVSAASLYLDEAVKPPAERVRWQARRDDAYRMAHQARAAAQAAVAEPPPVSALAIRVIPAATDLEDVVDAITAVSASAEVGVVDAPRVGALRDQLSGLAQVGSE